MNKHSFTKVFLLTPLLFYVCQACAQAITQSQQRTIQGNDYDPDGGADIYGSKGNHQPSPYYINPDFFEAISNGQLVILPHFKTMQQSTDWSCRNAAALMIL